MTDLERRTPRSSPSGNFSSSDEIPQEDHTDTDTLSPSGSSSRSPSPPHDVAEREDSTEPHPASASEEAGAAEDGSAEEAPQENRQARRRRKKVSSTSTEIPKDRNARVREQLLKKRIETQRAAQPLSAGELVDDVFARTVASTGKWLQKNATVVQYALLAVLLGGIGYGVWQWRATTRAEEGSSDLTKGILADRAAVESPPPATASSANPVEDEKPFPTFKTEDERENTALQAYRHVESADRGAGAAPILARLGEAGVLLDKRSWDEALTAYRDVKTSALANADLDVRGRALEGIGFALEGKGDKPGALHVYEQLETSGGKEFKILARYHQARLQASLGNKEKALELIKTAADELQANSNEFKASAYLRGVLENLRRTVSPPAPPSGAGAGGPIPPGAATGAAQQPAMEELLQHMGASSQESSSPPTSSPSPSR